MKRTIRGDHEPVDLAFGPDLSVVPKCLLADSIAGVVILPVRDGKVGLIRVFRYPLGKWSWEAVKGHAEPGEDARDVAARELLEESGFSVAADKFIDLGAIAPESGVIESHPRFFMVVPMEKAERAITPEMGHGELVFYTPAEIDDLIDRGKIEDASTVVLLLKHVHMLESKQAVRVANEAN